MPNGKVFFIVCVLSLVWSGWGGPVDLEYFESQLRILFPELFTHCTGCQYSEWTEWQFVKDSIVDVPTSQCDSGQSYSESRNRSATGNGCVSETETRVVCMPDLVDLLIDTFRLGAAQPVPTETPVTPPTPTTPAHGPRDPRSSDVSRRQSSVSENLCPGTGNNRRICRGLPYSTGKRSLSEENQPFVKRATRERKEPAPLPEAPIPYNREEHGKRFRRAPKACKPNEAQYILFVLDTSGSIRGEPFARMTKAVSKLTSLFCSPRKVATLTYSTDFNVEFCFDCFPADNQQPAAEAIKDIPFRHGSTNTGGAVRCICDKLLSPACGMDPLATCIDVVFITDGHSHDTQLNVCEEVKCLHNHVNGINTYAIGINDYPPYEEEIKCIASSSSLQSVFRLDDFMEFEAVIEEIERKIRLKPGEYPCFPFEDE